MRILALDTTTPLLSVAVMADDAVLAQMSCSAKRSTSSRLFPMIDTLLNYAGLRKGDIDFIALTVGPGSFTGVRVGVAAVKGLAYALKREVIAVSTLEAMAHLYPLEGMLLFPLLDARRGMFYGAMFRYINGSLERLTEDALLSREDVERVSGSVTFIGEVASRLGYPSLPFRELAPSVARIARKRAERGEFTRLFDLKPVYLRPSDAEETRGIIVYKD